jgi:prepilin-type N-terminal cleavage/methylation domain-containing protein
MQPGISRCAVAPDWGAHAPRVLAIAPTRSRTFLRQNASARRRNQHAGTRALPTKDRAFTLIELLVVITIIVILMGLLFPAFRGVQDQAKKTQAKNDLTQIVTAVNAFYAEYGKYPLPAGALGDGYPYGGASGNDSKGLFDALRGLDATQNPRQIVFMSPPDVKDAANPRAGIGTTTGAGQFFDPWGVSYSVTIDADYDNQVPNPYGANNGAGAAGIRQGVIAWSLGKDGVIGDNTKNDGKFTGSDDVISWQ